MKNGKGGIEKGLKRIGKHGFLLLATVGRSGTMASKTSCGRQPFAPAGHKMFKAKKWDHALAKFQAALEKLDGSE